jgi:hypothetical protein
MFAMVRMPVPDGSVDVGENVVHPEVRSPLVIVAHESDPRSRTFAPAWDEGVSEGSDLHRKPGVEVATRNCDHRERSAAQRVDHSEADPMHRCVIQLAGPVGERCLRNGVQPIAVADNRWRPSAR